MLDDFREWLSDNLRYFMLGGAILLVLFVLIFGIRACTKIRKKSPDQVNTENQVKDTSDTTTSEEPKKTEDDKTEDSSTDRMEQANEEITAIIKTYYEALGEKNIDKLNTVMTDLSPSDEARILNAGDYIERYEVDEVYVKPGLDENAKVVYVTYQYYCPGYTMGVPGLSKMYVKKQSDGSFKIDGTADKDTTVSAYTSQLNNESDVQALTAEVQNAYDNVLASNPELQAFLQNLGEDAGDSEDETPKTMMEATDDCYVRDGPSGEAIGGISYGTRVEKLGEKEGWIIIDYEGMEGYVYGELLKPVQ